MKFLTLIFLLMGFSAQSFSQSYDYLPDTSALQLCRIQGLDHCNAEVFYKLHTDTYYGASLYNIWGKKNKSYLTSLISHYAKDDRTYGLSKNHQELINKAEKIIMVVEYEDITYLAFYAYGKDIKNGVQPIALLGSDMLWPENEQDEQYITEEMVENEITASIFFKLNFKIKALIEFQI